MWEILHSPDLLLRPLTFRTLSRAQLPKDFPICLVPDGASEGPFAVCYEAHSIVLERLPCPPTRLAHLGDLLITPVDPLILIVIDSEYTIANALKLLHCPCERPKEARQSHRSSGGGP